MSAAPAISFAKFAPAKKGTLVILAGDKAALPASVADHDPVGVLPRAIAAADYKGKSLATLQVLAGEGMACDRVIIVSAAPAKGEKTTNWLKLGGVVASVINGSTDVTLVLDAPDMAISPEDAADVALGVLMRSYSFEKYKTKKDDDDKPSKLAKLVLTCADPAKAKKAFVAREAIAAGVNLARDMVNEPANILGPVEFAAHAKSLEEHGVEVTILTEKEMKKLKMGALLGVAQGSPRPPRLAVMQWNGGKKGDQPIAFIGKGVTFDTGGISIKPAAGMEDMKGDMGGAAAVIGLMRALAGRKAKANVIGILGLVENMPDGNAQRPGDIVTSMSGQTIEVLNTDAEGRLVLCDALHYCREAFKPAFMVNLATLTGAILVALGNHHAGLFSNNDELATRLTSAGLATDEKVWRMPLGPEYDKLIDSKTADMKNIGGRFAGSITAAQFLQRFVGDTPWAHLDVAGTAMGSPNTEINRSWGSGYGVRLLDRLVADHYEGK